MKISKYIYLSIIVIAVLFVWIYAPLTDEDEGLMAEISREMILNQDFISPRMNNEFRFDKPPFFNWLQVFSFIIFGENALSARFPAVIGAFFWFIYFKKILNSLEIKFNFTESLIFFSSFQIVILSIAGIQESINNACFLAIIYYIYFKKTNNQNLKIIILSVLISISFLTKGPLVIFLIFIIVSIDFLIDYFAKSTFNIKDFLSSKGFSFSDVIKIILLFLIISFPWYYKMYSVHGYDFINSFFLDHHLNRFFETRESHDGRLWFYVIVFLISNFPLIPFIINGLKVNINQKELRVFYIAIIVTFVFFTFSETKLHHYVVISYPAFIILAMFQLNAMNLKISSNLIMVFEFLIIVLLFYFYFESNPSNDLFINEIIKDSKLEIIQFISILLLLLILNFLQKNSVLKIIFSSIILSLSVFYFVAVSMQKPIIEIAKLISTKNLKVKNLDHYNPSLSFYSKKIIETSTIQKNEFVFAKINQIQIKNYQIYYRNKGYVLAKRVY